MDTLKYNAGRHAIHPFEVDRLAEFINSDRPKALKEKYGGDLFDYFAPSAKCVHCGIVLFPKMVDGIITYHIGDYHAGRGYVIDKCDGQDISDRGVMTAEIDVPSGVLVFANYFNDSDYELDVPDDEKYGEKYSLCTILGRHNTTQYYADRGIGFGQMGNMSIDVYSKKGRVSDTVLVGFPLDRIDDIGAPDYATRCAQFAGFKSRGHISLSVWRWMCMDKEKLLASGGMPDCDVVELKVVPGRYRIEHYYDHIGDTSDVYSKIMKVG